MRISPKVLVVAIAAAGVAQVPAVAATPRLPNIVYLLADDLGYGELGCYGQQRIHTPRLDRLAAEGMRFRQHYAGAPVCAPSRCVLLTGRSSGHATVRDNVEHQPEGQLPIGADEITLAELVHGHGYATGAYGKWGLGYPGSEGAPLRQGFDHFYGYNCQRHAHNHYPAWLWDDERKCVLEGNDGGRTGQQYAPDVILAAARAFVRANKERPFFLFVPFTLPHLALQVPDASLAEYQGAFAETPYAGKSYQPQPTPRACYAAMITHLDRSVGELLDELAAQGLTDDTIVMFSSDNGPTHLQEQVDVEFFQSAGPLHGQKGSVYEGGIRVPMIVRWPGHVAAGSSTELVSCFQDVMPTMAALVGAEVPAGGDGVSLLPTLLGHGDQQVAHPFLLWDFAGYGGQLALRAGKWKAVRRGLQAHPDAPVELYDLDADPSEQHDLALQEPAIVERLAAQMVQARTEPAEPRFRFAQYGDRAK